MRNTHRRKRKIVVHNHINEIDYNKLAEAIVKANEVSKAESQHSEKIGFWKAVWKIIRNKESKNGKRTAILLAEIMATFFNVAALIGLAFSGLILIGSIFGFKWNVEITQIIIQVAATAILILFALAISLIFRCIANEIGAEKDRNYITTLFFGFTSLASLIVALIALFQGVG